MQFKVPQNITMEDRIAGPLTVVQFSILVVGGGVSFLFLNILAIDPFNKIIAGILAFITVIMAIGRFNDQPMYRFFKFIFLFIAAPRVRVWHKAGGDNVMLVKPSVNRKHQDKTQVVKHVSKADIAKLAAVLDSRGDNSSPQPTPPSR